MDDRIDDDCADPSVFRFFGAFIEAVAVVLKNDLVEVSRRIELRADADAQRTGECAVVLDGIIDDLVCD